MQCHIFLCRIMKAALVVGVTLLHVVLLATSTVAQYHIILMKDQDRKVQDYAEIITKKYGYQHVLPLQWDATDFDGLYNFDINQLYSQLKQVREVYIYVIATEWKESNRQLDELGTCGPEALGMTLRNLMGDAADRVERITLLSVSDKSMEHVSNVVYKERVLKRIHTNIETEITSTGTCNSGNANLVGRKRKAEGSICEIVASAGGKKRLKKEELFKG